MSLEPIGKGIAYAAFWFALYQCSNNYSDNITIRQCLAKTQDVEKCQQIK